MNRVRILLVLLALAVPAAGGAQTALEVEFFPVPGSSGLPFSEAVRVGHLLFLAGQLGIVPGREAPGLADGGIEGETRQAMENIRAVLERHGSSLDRVVKCTVMLADISEWAAMNAVYVSFFDGRYPARSAMGVGGLARGARVEIECIATVG